MNAELPFVAIGKGESAPWEDLPLTCPACGDLCQLQYTDPGPLVLGYIQHCGEVWLRGPIIHAEAAQ